MKPVGYTLKKMIPFHCKRGKQGCEKCIEISLEGEKFCLLKLFISDDEVARPYIDVEINNETTYYAFEFSEIFSTYEKAMDYINANNIHLI